MRPADPDRLPIRFLLALHICFLSGHATRRSITSAPALFLPPFPCACIASFVQDRKGKKEKEERGETWKRAQRTKSPRGAHAQAFVVDQRSRPRPPTWQTMQSHEVGAQPSSITKPDLRVGSVRSAPALAEEEAESIQRGARLGRDRYRDAEPSLPRALGGKLAGAERRRVKASNAWARDQQRKKEKKKRTPNRQRKPQQKGQQKARQKKKMPHWGDVPASSPKEASRVTRRAWRFLPLDRAVPLQWP